MCIRDRITDSIYYYYIVNLCHGDVGREVRERYQAVSDRYYLICIITIHHSVGKHATVTLSADTTAVAVIVTGRCSNKCDIAVSYTHLLSVQV